MVQNSFAKEELFTTRALPSGEDLAVEIRTGSSSFVK